MAMRTIKFLLISEITILAGVLVYLSIVPKPQDVKQEVMKSEQRIFERINTIKEEYDKELDTFRKASAEVEVNSHLLKSILSK